jgi:putative holliday junction resolvase
VNPATRFLGFDFGQARIGVASGQRVTASASPLATIPARAGEPDWARIDRLIADWQPDALVVGIPVHLDGTEQPLTRAARRFAERLRERYGLPVHPAEERLSSRAAREAIADGRRAGAGRRTRKGDVDRMAARLILEQWLATRETDDD